MREPSLVEVLRSNFEYQMSNVNTAIPAVVVTVRDNLFGAAVDVQPTLNMQSYDGEVVERPVVLNVPLIFPMTRLGGITFPVSVGDTVLLVYSMRGMDAWKRSNGLMNTPTDFRKFDRRDCIAIPGLYPAQESPNNPSKRTHSHDTADTVVSVGVGTGNEVELRLKPSGDFIVNAPNANTVNANTVEVNAPGGTVINSNTRVNGTLQVTGLLSYGNGIAGTGGSNGNTISGPLIQTGGQLSSNGIVLDSHTHSNVQNGPNSTGGPQ